MNYTLNGQVGSYKLVTDFAPCPSTKEPAVLYHPQGACYFLQKNGIPHLGWPCADALRRATKDTPVDAAQHGPQQRIGGGVQGTEVPLNVDDLGVKWLTPRCGYVCLYGCGYCMGVDVHIHIIKYPHPYKHAHTQNPCILTVASVLTLFICAT